MHFCVNDSATNQIRLGFPSGQSELKRRPFICFHQVFHASVWFIVEHIMFEKHIIVI
jgi:hypothetical protein